jgi:hypothetical protein
MRGKTLLIPKPGFFSRLGTCSCIAKPQGCGECGKCRSIFPPTSCIHAVVIHPTIMYPIPLCRAEHWRFYWEQPEGVRQAGSRTLPERQGCPFWQTPIKTTERRKQAASGGFLLDTFLCPHKEKYPACQCGNWH